MAIVGMFMGGSPGALIAAGQAVLNLQWQAENRADIQGASFTVTGPGVNQTVQADTDGRASVTVPAGSYMVSVTHTGNYLNDEPVTVKTESQKAYMVAFYGFIDQTAKFQDAISKKLDKNATAYGAVRDGSGRNIEDIYATIEYVKEEIKKANIVINNPKVEYINNRGDYTLKNLRWSASAVPSEITATVTVTNESRGDSRTYYISNRELIDGFKDIPDEETNWDIVYDRVSGILTLSTGVSYRMGFTNIGN